MAFHEDDLRSALYELNLGLSLEQVSPDEFREAVARLMVLSAKRSEKYVLHRFERVSE